MTFCADSPKPQWPAWGHDRRWAWCLADAEPLRTVAKSYLQRGELHALVVLDSALRLFSVDQVRELGRAGLFGWRPGFAGTYVRVEIAWRCERQLTLEDARQYVLEFLVTHPRVYDSGMSYAELSSAVMAARSAEDLFAVL